jgi:hypothetical protein
MLSEGFVRGLLDYKTWIVPTCVNQANSSVDSRKVQVRLLDHPWSELDDLFCRERLLCN